MAKRGKKPLVNLTDAKVAALTYKASDGRNETYDKRDRGFGVRVAQTGKKVWLLYARYPLGKRDARGKIIPERRIVGDFSRMSESVARKKARDWLDKIKDGIDPKTEIALAVNESRRKNATFEIVAEAYIVGRKKFVASRRYKATSRDIRRNLIAPWRDRPICHWR